MELQNVQSLEELLQNADVKDFPSAGEKKHIDRYTELKQKFQTYKVETGAMASEISTWLEEVKGKIEEINKETDEIIRKQKLDQIFLEDPIVYLNRHDKSHIEMVQKRALQILQCCANTNLSAYEVYLLLCATVVHDVGNITGRKRHERKINQILENECQTIIPDTLERKIISRIARAHGGGSEDVFSYLKENSVLYGFTVRERLIAAIVRFADELADDYTRADYAALETGAITDASKIYHVYSSSLHTVSIKRNEFNDTYEVFLSFAFDTKTACTYFGAPGNKKLLLNEIYDRTIKMERERRYCFRFIRAYCPLEKIRVEITISDPFDEFVTHEIKYTLEEKGYPVTPYLSIATIDSTLKSGEEWYSILNKDG